MRHPIRWILIGVAAVPVLLFAVANGLAVSPDETPPPDPRMLITMPDGHTEPLFRVIADSNLVEEVTGRKSHQPEPIADAPAADAAPGQPDLSEQALAELRSMDWEPLPPPDGDIFGLAEYSLRQGDVDQALALFLSLPKNHPRYAKAQRRIGWDIYTRAMDEPDRGLAYVNRSVLDDPSEGNAWQDALRVYAATLGFLVN